MYGQQAPDGRLVLSLGVPPKLGLLGELLSGNTPDAPTTIDRGDVFYAPVPTNLTTEIKLTQGRQEAIVTSPTPTTVEAQVNLISPGDEKDIDATVDQLPTSVDIVHQTQNGHDTTTYTANAPVNQVNVNYHDHQGRRSPRPLSSRPPTCRPASHSTRPARRRR